MLFITLGLSNTINSFVFCIRQPQSILIHYQFKKSFNLRSWKWHSSQLLILRLNQLRSSQLDFHKNIVPSGRSICRNPSPRKVLELNLQQALILVDLHNVDTILSISAYSTSNYSKYFAAYSIPTLQIATSQLTTTNYDNHNIPSELTLETGYRYPTYFHRNERLYFPIFRDFKIHLEQTHTKILTQLHPIGISFKIPKFPTMKIAQENLPPSRDDEIICTIRENWSWNNVIPSSTSSLPLSHHNPFCWVSRWTAYLLKIIFWRKVSTHWINIPFFRNNLLLHSFKPKCPLCLWVYTQ